MAEFMTIMTTDKSTAAAQLNKMAKLATATAVSARHFHKILSSVAASAAEAASLI